MRFRDIMRCCLYCVIAVACAIPTWGSPAEDDPYSMKVVRELLKQPSGFSSGFSEKQVARMGDRMSIALLKIYRENEVTRPENVRLYLPLIVESFRSRNLISSPEDRKPQVTLVLLGYLEATVTDPTLKKSIRSARAEIENETVVN